MTAQVALAARAATSNAVRPVALGERAQSVAVATDRRSLWGSLMRLICMVSDSCKACCRIPLVSPQNVILSFGDQFGVRGIHSHIVAGGRRPTAGDRLIQLRTYQNCWLTLLILVLQDGLSAVPKTYDLCDLQ